MSRFASAISVFGAAWLAAGCATVTSGTTQQINIDSEPQAADCTLTREGVTLGSVTTPAPITIKRHASTIHVVCKRAGYEDGRVVMNSRFETASAGNFVLGGIIGVIVDSSTGANSRYETNVLVRLEALSAADQKIQAAAAAAKPQLAAAPAPPAPAVQSGGPFDGDYDGGVELTQEGFGRYSSHLRRFDVLVKDGVGTGTAKHPQCSNPGKVDLKIDASGQIKGTANVLSTATCNARTGQLEGRMEGDRMRLTIRFQNEPEPVAFVLARAKPR